MSVYMGIIIGLPILSYIFASTAIEMEAEALRGLLFVFSLLFIIADVAIIAATLTSTAAVSMAYSLMSVSIMLLLFTLLYYMLGIIANIIESTQKK